MRQFFRRIYVCARFCFPSFSLSFFRECWPGLNIDFSTGSLPEALGNLEALQELAIGYNGLGGESQPVTTGTRKWSSHVHCSGLGRSLLVSDLQEMIFETKPFRLVDEVSSHLPRTGRQLSNPVLSKLTWKNLHTLHSPRVDWLVILPSRYGRVVF